MSRIAPLPADVISQIHSAKNITSLPQVVFALLENSLDANATKIEVTVDFRRGGCTVDDDGDGIPCAEFGKEGGLGKMYHTSKRLPDFDRTHELHGCNGTYLASLASLSLLSITSRQTGNPSQATFMKHQGKVISPQTSTSSSELGNLMSHGTQVTVRDLFGNMPVRVKQRALTSDTGNDDDKAWHILKHGIAALLLAWPKPCAVRLADSNRVDSKVQLAGSHPSTELELTRRGLRQLDRGRKAPFGLKEALAVVFQAGLSLSVSRSNWVPVSASAVDITVKGLICLDPAPTKQCQFVSLGVHPCASTPGSNGDMYDAINKVFVNSSFGAAEDLSDVDEQEKDRRKRDRRFKGDGYTQRQLHARKGVDRWPMFILQIAFRNPRPTHATVDNISDTALRDVVGVLEATVTEWLAAHHFRPRKKRGRRKNEHQQRPASASSTRMSSTAQSAKPGQSSMHATSPGVRRIARSCSSTTIKRRRVDDASGGPHCVDQPSVRSKSGDAHSPFGLWSRIKSGRETSRGEGRDMQRAMTAPEGQKGAEANSRSVSRTSAFTLPAIEAGALNATRQQHANIHSTTASHNAVPAIPGSTAISSEDFGSINDEEMVAVAVETETGEDEIVDWVDPRSKQKYRVNTRTGVVLPLRDKSARTVDHDEHTHARQLAALNTTFSSKGNPLSLARRGTPTRLDVSRSETANTEWLPGFLQGWNIPVFVHQEEESIPVALPDGPTFEADEASKHRYGHQTRGNDLEMHGNGVAATVRLDKLSLQSTKVISQVDRKFILCKTQAHGGDSSSGRETLILVDQHAASERVILENLLAELCEPVDDESSPSAVRTTLLDKPLRFQISEQEQELLNCHSAHFANWGVLYGLSRCEERLPASQNVRAEREIEHVLTVTHLPPGIAERCNLVPRILIEMLRSEVWVMAGSNVKARPDMSNPPYQQQQHDWLQRIGSCPRGLVEMLNSRACRSAIMFNDELSVRQCEELVERLAGCAFSFMCAHGRVSMVPLIGFGVGHGDDGDAFGPGEFGLSDEKAGKGEKSFSAAFGQWRERGRSSGESFE